ncbi:hypothetical protein RF11_11555 [Thelohanellus kitauei]|uniref:Uncharacterized protein n=1 Tax=Thelohanellus kitauei TaxID=669202 RepID=A0A0C2MX56_THEKT|nr:hypothetical protein RF11_11555 [Thelohanellus kitauei]
MIDSGTLHGQCITERLMEELKNQYDTLGVQGVNKSVSEKTNDLGDHTKETDKNQGMPRNAGDPSIPMSSTQENMLPPLTDVQQGHTQVDSTNGNQSSASI